MDILKETPPLSNTDCFRVFARDKKHFDFPLHYHDEYELNFIFNAAGAQRIVGNHLGEIDDLECVLVGPELIHCWTDGNSMDRSIHEITIQFSKSLFGEAFLQKMQMMSINDMLSKASRGILFSRSTINSVMPQVLTLTNEGNFKSLLNFMQLLHDLSVSSDMTILSTESIIEGDDLRMKERIKKVIDYMRDNYSSEISLKDVADVASMTEVSFSRFFKKNTGRSYVECLNDIRLGQVSRLLINTEKSISEIAYECGFNNIANFNRAFRRKRGMTPKEYRAVYREQITYI